MKERILSNLTAECPWRDTLYWYDTVDSTNTLAKKLAAEGAPQGTILLAGHQTAGRGRMDRSFHSPAGSGLYLSLILRPHCPANELLHLTCAAAVAMCRAIESSTGYLPEVKWINDLVGNGKKLGGILTELSVDTKTGLVNYAVLGIGINCTQDATDFPPELQSIATSLKAVTGSEPDIPRLAASAIYALWQISEDLLAKKSAIMADYRNRCNTCSKDIWILRGDSKKAATALSIDDDGGLLVRLTDGTLETVNSGEVSIRAQQV